MITVLVQKICFCGYVVEDPIKNDLCNKCGEELVESLEAQEEAYRQAREERYESAMAAQETWRLQRYEERLQEQAERARAWREEQYEPSDEERQWSRTLRNLALMGAGRYDEVNWDI